MRNTVLFLFIAMLVCSCGGKDEKEAGEANNNPVREKAPSVNSEAFNQSFERLLTDYYSLKDAMVEYDTVKANATAAMLLQHADSLVVDQFPHDSTGVVKENARSFAGTISGSAAGLMGEKDITRKKKEFQMISDAMYDLIRTVKYDRQKIYHQRCPMAFDNETEAYWLSNSSAIVNPYLGKKHPKYKDKMLECGDITDSLN